MPSTRSPPTELVVISAEELEIKWDCLDQSLLGSGKFGNVFHVFYDGYDAVLKKSRNEEDAVERENMMREAKVVASLNNCGNVIRIYGVCEEPPFRGLIMEYCAGPSLAELVFQLNANQVKVEALRVYRWCHELAETLCELNTTHFHGDLKPQNVIVKERPCCCANSSAFDNISIRNSGPAHVVDQLSAMTVLQKTYMICQQCKGVHLEHISLKIIDFGMSFRHGTRRKYQGTLQYAAPETLNGFYDEKSEVFSFGLLMLTLVIGKPTDQCEDEQKRFLTLRNSPTFVKCASNSICQTITACTHEDPSLRPSFITLYDLLNEKHEHYQTLRNGDGRIHANKEREEFLVHYKFMRKMTRTVTTSTVLTDCTEGCSGSQELADFEPFAENDFPNHSYENNVFVDSPYSSPPSSRRNSDGYEVPTSGIVENPVYTGDESVVQLPYSSRTTRTKRSVWRSLKQARKVIFRFMKWR